MLSYDDALNMNYYEKVHYSGWMGGMRFRLQKETVVNEETSEEKSFFHAWVWPGPYIFDKVEDGQKTDATFPFEEAGRIAAVDWINEQFESRADEWPRKKMDITTM